MVTAKSILRGEKENEILSFSPYLLVILDTLISFPPSFLCLTGHWPGGKMKQAKTEE